MLQDSFHACLGSVVIAAVIAVVRCRQFRRGVQPFIFVHAELLLSKT